MYLRKYKISKAAFLENTSQQLPLYIIWFRVSPNRKYYFMSETYLKPSQTSKMKLLVKVVNASRGVFKTVFSIHILLGPKNASGFTVFNYFHQKLHLRSLRGQIYLCMYLVPQIWRWINEISKVGYEETQKNM